MSVPTLQSAIQIIDPDTGQPQPHFVQWWNELARKSGATTTATTSSTTVTRAKGRFVYG